MDGSMHVYEKTSFDVVIVGAGHAGAQAAVALRQKGFSGSIAVVGDEPDLPYERPPLSKEYLSGEKEFDRLLLKSSDFWKEKGIVILPGREVDMVDPSDKKIIADDGSVIVYGSLVWATGGRARRLRCDGASLEGVHSVRRRSDVDAIVAGLAATDRVVIVGGGFIGLETAAALTKFGKQVTVLEAQDRVLARVAGPEISRFYTAEHQARGVEIRLGAAVDAILGHEGKVCGVRLADGERLDCGMVIVGIGIVPAIDALISAGTSYDYGNGVRVDEFCRTSMPDMYAIGDCALHRNKYAGGAEIRLESVQNANDMANTVAKTITGTLEAYDAIPWFWSNQYDLRLQTVGISSGYDEEIVRGDIGSRSFSVAYLKDGRVLAIDCVNSTKDYVQAKPLIASGVRVERSRIADPSVALKDLR